MSEPSMLREERDGATMVLTMDNQARRNALSLPLQTAMIAALERIEADPAIRAVVLTGAGGVFSSGGDIAGMEVPDLGAGRRRLGMIHRMVRQLAQCSKPVIAAVEGWCAGGAIGVALCCDTIIAAADARFFVSFGRVGLVADLGMLHTLPLRVGHGRARQMLLYGETLDAAAAEKAGLADHVVPSGTALAAALDRARVFAQAAPLPVVAMKQYLGRGLEDALDWERDVQSSLFLSADHAEGRAAFLAKRPPVFEGR
jgi:2-(1,2-epoxy-1,2-dihydrophenyl)acetyl-CoA isomerase